ncbi:MAG: HAMP domain-containing histidine kinase [Rhodospirillales bacterium]|nr:HAMP domain-containing histidine kinase [Rhodospirillales bacterium]
MNQTAPKSGRASILSGLSARLLALIVAFIMLSEVLIYAPSIARFRADYFQGRIAAAHLATLALEATPDNMVSEELKNQLLDHAGAYAVIIANPGEVRRILTREMPPRADATYDLRRAAFFGLIADAFMTLAESEPRVLRIIGLSPKDKEVVVEVLLDERPMRTAMIDFSWRILALSLVISFLTAALVYLSLQWLMVRPLRQITQNMILFRKAPENPANAIAPSDRRDEIGIAQRELAAMEKALRAALNQQARLAALGVAVTKINHDLRNILASARLVSDRLADSNDPQVKRVAPTLLASIDRAVALSGQTLDYARDEPPPPVRSHFPLADLGEEVGRIVGLLTDNRSTWENAVDPAILVDADRDQMFRVLVNLGRNAAEAGARRIRLAAAMVGGDLTIEVGDDGPGLPAKARDNLFQPFAGSARAGGTGLGLAIARDLVRAHGGEMILAATSPVGTTFRIVVPGVAVTGRHRAAQ